MTANAAEVETAEVLEAQIRTFMAKHAAIEPRGFDTIRARAELHRRIDTLLEKHSAAVLLATIGLAE